MREWRALARLMSLVWLALLGPVEHSLAQAQEQQPQVQPPRIQVAPLPQRLAVQVRVVAIPSVAGASIDQARRTLKAAGFDSRLAPNQTPDERSHVERTVPPAGTTYRSGEPRPVVEIVLRDQLQQRLVPSIVGKTCAEAQALLAESKLRIASCAVGSITGRVRSGTVHTQRPVANAPIDPTARTVDAIVEPDSVAVPAVIGLPAPQAKALIEQARLRAQASLTPMQPWHRVRGQKPDAGQRVTPGSEVVIDLVFTVPALRGIDCDEARRRVLAAGHRGLDCRVEIVSSPSGEPGRIFRQAPAAESVTREPATVQAFTPLLRIRVPALVGLPEDAAQRALSQARLAPRLSGPPAASGRVVAAQSPEPQTLVEPGATVDLRLALTVPNLRGASCDGARTLAQRHGFEAFDCRRRVTSPSAALGRVFEQSPTARSVLAVAQPLEATVAQGISVPQVTGLDPRSALARLREVRLDGRSDATDGDRIVVRQRPQADAEVAPATRVDLVTQRMTQVPGVVGLMLAEALPLIAGRELRGLGDASDAPTMRRVRGQQPAPDTRVAVGQAVSLTTVLETLVPDVIDKPLEEAVTLVERAGLSAQVDASPRPGPKTVRRQQPAADERVQAGSAVALRAVTRVQVPEVRQRTCDEAREVARAAGLDAGPCSVEGRFGVRLGTPIVWQQSPEAGRTVDEGETMVLGARTPVAPVVALGAGLGVLLAAGTLVFVKRPSKSGPPSSPPPPRLDVRIAVDPAPTVAIRAPADQADNRGGAPARNADHEFERALRLRIDAAAARVWIRAWDPSDREAPDGGDPNPGERPT